MVVVTSQDSKRAQPKENRPPSETGENGRAVGKLLCCTGHRYVKVSMPAAL